MSTRAHRLATTLMPAVRNLRLDHIEISHATISVGVTSTQPTACCPRCGNVAQRVRSRYHRTLTDLPWGGYAVSLHLAVRKFACDVVSCRQRIFTERLPQLTQSYARRTNRRTDILRVIAFALGGEGGRRVLDRLCMPTSGTTLLRVIRRSSLSAYAAPRVVGIDDWARRRGQTYGSIVVDLERRRPIELLPDRTVATMRDWLAGHPHIEVISRDRGGVYAEAAASGAPTAVQVADRWHLLHNLADALERAFMAHRARIRQVLRPDDAQSPLDAAAAIVTHVPPPVPSPRTQVAIAARRTTRLARYETVQTLRARGMSQRTIAEQVGLNPKTVQRWLAAGSFPELPPRRSRGSRLDPYTPFLLERWAAGCHNGTRLYSEIVAQGYTGGRTTVRDFLARLRPRRGMGSSGVASNLERSKASNEANPPSLRQLVWYVLRRDEKVTEDEQAAVARLRTAHADVAQAVEFAQTFATMVRQRQPERLEPWLWQVANSHVAALRSFAAGIQRDKAAVVAGLTLEWSQELVAYCTSSQRSPCFRNPFAPPSTANWNGSQRLK